MQTYDAGSATPGIPPSGSNITRVVPAICYLLLSFPLGLIYFILLVLTLSLSVGLLVLWIGIPLLVLGIALIWMGARFERHLTMSWLSCDIPSFPVQQKQSWLQFLRARLAGVLRHGVCASMRRGRAGDSPLRRGLS